jgi:hypothetical protein
LPYQQMLDEQQAGGYLPLFLKAMDAAGFNACVI